MRFVSILLTALLVWLAPLSARIWPEPGYFTLGIDVFWLEPLLQHTYYAVQLESTFNEQLADGRMFKNQPKHKVGYRLEAIYSFCNECNSILARWTHLPHHKTTDHAEGNLGLVQAYPRLLGSGLMQTRVESQIDFRFYSADLLVGHSICSCSCLDLELQGGLHFAHAKRHDQITSFTPTGGGRTLISDYNTHFWGVGPEIALDGYYFPCPCTPCGEFYFYGESAVAILISKNHTKSIFTRFQNVEPTTLTIQAHPEGEWKGVPAAAIRFGLGYDTGLCGHCWAISVDIGYQVIHYSHAIQRLLFYDDTVPNVSDDVYSDVTLYGPYASFGLTF